MSRKSKGIDAERELIHMFWAVDFACIRSAGSGSNRYCSPDILAGNALRRIAIEAKSTKFKIQYLTKQEVSDLQFFAKAFGAEAWIAVRFKGGKWFFLNCEDLKNSGKNFSVSEELAEMKGLIFDELIDSKNYTIF